MDSLKELKANYHMFFLFVTLRFIGISNETYFPETLTNCVKSRLGNRTLRFKAYSSD